MSLMTQINLAEVERISATSKRPRFALCTWLALLDLVGDSEAWNGERNELAAHVEALLPPGRYEARAAARIERVQDVRKREASAHKSLDEDLATLAPGDEREAASQFHHAMIRMGADEAVGHPLAQNVSRTLSELRAAGLVGIEYIDPRGEAHTKPARGRTLSVSIYRRDS